MQKGRTDSSVNESKICVLNKFAPDNLLWTILLDYICDVPSCLYIMVSVLKVNLDGQVALDIVHRLFENVAPSVFRPVDILLKVLLAKPNDLVSMQIKFTFSIVFFILVFIFIIHCLL